MANEQRTTPEQRASLRRTPAEYKPDDYVAFRGSVVAALLDDADALAGALAERDRYWQALRAIQGWDCLNPPNAELCADFPWLRRLVDAALEPGQNRATVPLQGQEAATDTSSPGAGETAPQTQGEAQ